MGRFVDTNILLYTISSAAADREKRNRARAVLDAADLVLSALAGCDEIVTEDRQDGAAIAGVRMCNPFR